MTNIIHPTAIVHPEAKLGTNNYIGPYCLIGPNVEIGSNNRLEAHICIGTPAEHRDYFHSAPGPVKIGNNNVLREYVAVTGGTTGCTQVGDNVTMLRGSHLGHDVIVRNKAILSFNVLIAGHSIIGEGANLGLSASVHQFRAIGAYAMVGMNSTVTRNIPPFVVAFGSPAEPQRINQIGLTRSGGVQVSDLTEFEEWFFKQGGLFDNPQNIGHDYNRFLTAFNLDRESFNKK